MPISFKIMKRRPLNLRGAPSKTPVTSHPPAAAGPETKTAAPAPDENGETSVGDSNKNKLVKASKEVASSAPIGSSKEVVGSSKLQSVDPSKPSNPSKPVNPSELVKSSKPIKSSKSANLSKPANPSKRLGATKMDVDSSPQDAKVKY